jgi:hypothetical protein
MLIHKPLTCNDFDDLDGHGFAVNSKSSTPFRDFPKIPKGYFSTIVTAQSMQDVMEHACPLPFIRSI